jgi:hypothetical protein
LGCSSRLMLLTIPLTHAAVPLTQRRSAPWSSATQKSSNVDRRATSCKLLSAVNRGRGHTTSCGGEPWQGWCQGLEDGVKGGCQGVRWRAQRCEPSMSPPTHACGPLFSAGPCRRRLGFFWRSAPIGGSTKLEQDSAMGWSGRKREVSATQANVPPKLPRR